MVGQTAAMPRVGGAEVGMSVGVGYQSIDEEGNETGGDAETALSVPAYEGNVQYGLSDSTAFNLHVSNAGLEPGVKIGLVRGPGLKVAVLPSFAVGRFSADSGDGDEITYTSVLAGARVLASTEAGLYGAIGYSFQRITATEEGDDDRLDSHNIALAVGGDMRSGGLIIRPELAVIYAPMSDPDSEVDNDITGLWVFPNVSFAIRE